MPTSSEVLHRREALAQGRLAADDRRDALVALGQLLEDVA